MLSDSKNIYCLDSSICITLNRFYPQRVMPDLWTLLDELATERKIFSHEYVYEELVPSTGPVDDIGYWAIKNKKIFQSINWANHPMLVRQILTKFPKLINPNNPKNQADPWLVAMMMDYNQAPNLLFPNVNELVLVSNENKNSTVKIPAACIEFGIKHLDMFEFFGENGIEFSVVRKG